MIIKPTVGRIVWFHNDRSGQDPIAAIVTKVHNDNCVNLVVFDCGGDTDRRAGVHLRQPGSTWVSGGEWCEWMPYQKGQAERTMKAEAAVVDAELNAIDREDALGGEPTPYSIFEPTPDGSKVQLKPEIEEVLFDLSKRVLEAERGANASQAQASLDRVERLLDVVDELLAREQGAARESKRAEVASQRTTPAGSDTTPK